MLNSLVSVLQGGAGAGAATAYESISTVTVGSGGSSTVTFSSIPSTYTHLQIRIFGQTSRGTYGSDELTMRVGNGSVDTGSNYSVHNLTGNGASVSSGGSANTSNINLNYKLGTTTSNAFGVLIIDILDYANTNKYKTVRNLTGVDINGTVAGFGGEIELSSGSWRSLSSINTITFTPTNANFTQYTSFALYGIKGA